MVAVVIVIIVSHRMSAVAQPCSLVPVPSTVATIDMCSDAATPIKLWAAVLSLSMVGNAQNSQWVTKVHDQVSRKSRNAHSALATPEISWKPWGMHTRCHGSWRFATRTAWLKKTAAAPVRSCISGWLSRLLQGYASILFSLSSKTWNGKIQSLF